MSTVTAQPALRFKGSLFSITVMQLLSDDTTILQEQLDTQIAQAPKFFNGAPIIFDTQQLPDLSLSALQKIITLMRNNKMIPIGARGLPDELTKQASSLGLALFNSPREELPTQQTDQPIPKPKVNKPNDYATKLITKPVRSGQQIYAKNKDLIVLTTVSEGAELLADGNIHVYGTLRGRALAGVNGNDQARIFCQTLAAELVSIAGHYCIRESLEASEYVGAHQIYLNAETKLCIEPLT